MPVAILQARKRLRESRHGTASILIEDCPTATAWNFTTSKPRTIIIKKLAFNARKQLAAKPNVFVILIWHSFHFAFSWPAGFIYFAFAWANFRQRMFEPEGVFIRHFYCP